HIFDVGETVDSAVQLLSAQALEKRLDLTAFVDPALPSELSGDSGLLRKLVLNLVGNAIKFTSEGGVAVEVRKLTPLVADDSRPNQPITIELTVRDTGIGIPKDKLATIFDRFSQADASTKRLYEGTGLGLAICKEIAALMDGAITVESEVGAGSAFRATLTLHHLDPEAPSLRDVMQCDLAQTKILVVDDNALNRRIAELQLSAFGAQTTTVASAAEGLGALAQAAAIGAPYEVALIDQMMPNMDGLTLLKMIRADSRYDTLKTILSSSAGVRTDKDARKLGFDAAAPKPVNQGRLVAAILDLISGAETDSDQDWREAAVEAVQQPTPPQPATKPRLLLVDDNAANLKLAELMLKGMGYCVDKACNGVEAIDAAAKFSYAAILMDVRMPVMDGVEATRRIRQLPAPISATPIIAVTADIADNGEAALVEAGMDAVIGKPVNDQTLRDVLAEMIASDVADVA
ncbi:MAG: response regulator, partial [Rhodobacteraceae bacterium]|nr:response regulator [Paracoccaceae bacterium]